MDTGGEAAGTAETGDGKVVPQERLPALVAALRRQGKKIVLTNGCFDLLHVGHLRSLRAARAEGDVLLVAINSDASVRANKGADYPVVPEGERAEMLAAYPFVDQVFLFSERTLDRLILLLQPDVHAKGTDYSAASVPEREAVLSYGGRIAITGDPKNHSSRDLIRIIVERFGSRG